MSIISQQTVKTILDKGSRITHGDKWLVLHNYDYTVFRGGDSAHQPEMLYRGDSLESALAVLWSDVEVE